MEVISILLLCIEKNTKVYSITEIYKLGNNIGSKVLAFAFGLSGEIERKLISQRIKEALARKKNGKKNWADLKAAYRKTRNPLARKNRYSNYWIRP